MMTIRVHVHPRQGCGWSVSATPGQSTVRSFFQDTTIDMTQDGAVFCFTRQGTRYLVASGTLEEAHQTADVTVEGWPAPVPEWVWARRAKADPGYGIPSDDPAARAKIEELRARVCLSVKESP